jgi:pectinesterase
MLNRVNSPAWAAAVTLLLLALFCLSSSSHAAGASAMPGSTSKLLTVDQSGNGDHTKIQDAIDAVPANSSAATVIRIRPGVYRQVTVIDHYLVNF